MARPSYGPEAKKRSRRLLEVLLVYANDAIACRDEATLDALRPQIQTRWLSEHRLVVRTKVRFLQALTTLAGGEGQLNAEQIKEALKRFADFLEILEDNRPSRGGSENWHFTLNLWHKRQDTEANLQQFDVEWESRRPDKSKQVAGEDRETRGQGGQRGESCLSTSSPTLREAAIASTSPDWKELCCNALKAQNHQRLTTNPLTSADGVSFELDQVYVPLGLVERKHRLRHDDDVNPQEGSRLYEPEDTEITQTFNHDEFLQQLLEEQQNQRIAIVGEPGAGKTTLLQKIAAWVLDNTEDLPVWIDLADLQGKTLEQYLIQDWLPAAIRKLRVPAEIEEAFCEQFNQGRVWLLLDAVDEMAIESSQALSKIASCLNGWVGDARVILTCRLNVWDGGKNALQSFITYRNLNFSYSNGSCNQVGQFIRRWFQENPACGESLQAELDQPERRRLKDAVKNPLRLALLCRTWGLTQGRLPTTKAMLYEQFVEVIYEWKQDRFPTTLTQRQQLNRALGELALLAIAQEKTKFRLRHRFVYQVLGTPDDGLFQLALQLGWLNQVGISETQGEKVYAFYHPTFQEYFASQAVSDWHFFLNHTLHLEANNQNLPSSSPPPSYRIFAPQWREIILLWLGRDDIPQVHKEEFIQALIEFSDDCGGYYSYQAYFVAALGIAEFADCQKADEIVQQLVEWRFGYDQIKNQKPWRYPAPIVECARVALLKTDRPKAIAALEKAIKSSQNQFDTWNAAYSLGKVFDPGNKTAIAALEQLVKTVRHESIRWQAAYSLGRVDLGNQIAIAALVEIIASTKNESTRRKAAYSLGKIDAQNAIAISTLEKIAESAIDASQRRQALENLATLHGNELSNCYKKIEQPSDFRRNRRSKRKKQPTSSTHYSINSQIAELLQSITSSLDEDTQRRRAYKLAQLDPGNLVAFTTLLQLIKSTKSVTFRKRIADNLKEILLNEQFPEVVTSLKNFCLEQVQNHELEGCREYFKLIWHCAENMDYLKFYRVWHQ